MNPTGNRKIQPIASQLAQNHIIRICSRTTTYITKNMVRLQKIKVIDGESRQYEGYTNEIIVQIIN